MEEFSTWVLENGGDGAFLEILKKFGFNSKLSLGNLDFDSDDSSALVSQMNCGQKCLLRGLVRAVTKDDVYSTASTKATQVMSKSNSLRSTLGKLFNRKGKYDDEAGPSSSCDDFQPAPNMLQRKRTGKGKYPMKGPIKRKVKEYRLKVVGMKHFPSCAPVGAERESQLKTVWVRESSSADELATKIREAFGWSELWSVQFMYSSGRHLRLATLNDVEHANSWDVQTVRALMGSGCLYVVRYADTESKPAPCEVENDPALGVEMDKLSDMFPAVTQEELREALTKYSMDETIEKLLSAQPLESNVTKDASSNVIPDEDEHVTLQSLLHCLARKVVDITSEYRLSVDRSSPDNLWQIIMSFYKSTRVKPYKLKQELVVDFCNTGEVGADSGALRREFFEDSILQANIRLLEGEDDKRVVKKDWGMDLEYESFGTMVAHSILQGGPGVPCLSVCMFDFLTGKEVYPVKEDIPLNAATHQLITFIEELNDASTEDEIDGLLDVPANSYILNNCGWKITEPIIPSNKLNFLQHLIHNEVITQREKNLKSFFRGLNCLGVGDLVQDYPTLSRSLFVPQLQPITVDVFVSLISSKRPEIPLQAKVYDYFMEFITYLDGNDSPRWSLGSLLRFVTGVSTVPPLGFMHLIELSYCPITNTNTLPQSHACFSQLVLPIVHESKDEFFAAFIKAFELGGGFGNV